MTTSLDICKQALASIGTRSSITSLTDGSPEANYCSLLYAPLRDFLLREGDYDFAMTSVVPVVAGVGVPPPWAFIYNYPATALRIRQVWSTLQAALDPKPIQWNIYSFSGVKYIVTRESINSVLITYAPIEDMFDAIFRESFVRLLGSALAFALENRIEASKKELEEAISFAGIANLRDS